MFRSCYVFVRSFARTCRQVTAADHDAADAVLQFSNISSPWILIVQIGANPLGRLVGKSIGIVTRQFATDVAYQRRQVIRILLQLTAQTRSLNTIRTQPIVQVFAKTPRLHLLIKISIGSANDLSEKLLLPVVAKCSIGALLHDAQQFHLQH